MSIQNKLRVILPLLIFLAFSISACDNGTPTPTPQAYNPGCSVANLISHINMANNAGGPVVIN